METQSMYYTITSQDVGKRTISVGGYKWLITDVMGHILPTDIGKRVYVIDGILQVESESQCNSRLAKSQSIDIRALARSIEHLSAIADALEIVTDLQSNPDCSSVGWRILNRIASRLRREIKLESEGL